MNNYLKNILFVAPIAAIFAVGIGLHYINKSKQPEPSASSNTSAYDHPTFSAKTTVNPPDTVNYQNYAMPEPFAAHAPFNFTPAAWMQMMNNMMNNMQMTQMMHQMANMPSQMMNPTMWINPHGMLPNGAANQSQQPMNPKEYKKWYEQQLKLQQTNK